MQGHPLPRKAHLTAADQDRWHRRFAAELRSLSPRRDPIVRLIGIERIVRAVVLAVLAVAIVYLGSRGTLYVWAREAQNQLVLGAGHGVLTRLLDVVLVRLGNIKHLDLAALALLAYCALEMTEGIGLWFWRRWAEYLTAVATAIFIPFEVVEVIHRVTFVRVGALIVNVAIVVYLVISKRLFIDV